MKKRQKVLIVDDEAEICFLLLRILRNRSYEADCVNSLEEAVSAIRTSEPSLIFLDNHLPDGLGIQFVNYLKEFYPQIKVVIITGQELSYEDCETAENLPVILFKPFTSESIYSVIEEMAL
ncbi:MAG TPA: response regulator [Bacteroidales bacterium]|nr:response regulator [Bacteroidales bacterium]